MVGEGEPGHGASDCAGFGVGRHAERFVPAELDLLEQDLDGLGRGVQIARSAAQEGTAARARHQLLTWRAVVPVRRANSAWLTPARASRAANSVPRSAFMGPLYRTGFHRASFGACRCGRLGAIRAVIAPGGISPGAGSPRGGIVFAVVLTRALG